MIAILALAACGGQAPSRPDVAPVPHVAAGAARLPAVPGEYAPSLVAIDDSPRDATRGGVNGPALPGQRERPRLEDVTDGNMLSDVDSCASCHPDAAAQWSTSAHSFASFGNPIYRVSVEMLRTALGKPASQHCGGCHDMPLMTDGLMTAAAAIPAADLRAHSGVTCRLCHGIERTTNDGNGSYVWSRAPLEAPTLGDPASIARHKAQATVVQVGTELCVGCHRGFISADMAMPVHLSGLDEPGAWRNSAWTGNGMARVDKVAPKTCIDCHMEREPASAGEYGAKAGTIASHRFLGGHTWMAAMRGDTEHLRRLQAKLEGAASIDVAGVRISDGSPGAAARWVLPADGAEVAPGAHLALDVVIRNLLVGHRFPGGVLDIQDAWIEVEVADAKGARLAASGLDHARDPDDQDTHVLRTLVVDDRGEVLEQHEMASFRTQIATQTLAAREAQVIRYAFDVPAGLTAAQLPLTVTARLRHRSRTLQMQAVVCKAARTAEGQAFIAGAKGAREVVLDPCKPQPITLIAETRVQLGRGAAIGTARPAWERIYEHGMALVATVSERLDEARDVLEAALAAAPAGEPRARAMVLVQLAQVAAKQGRADDALALIAEARPLLPSPGPPVLDAVAADALSRVWRWDEAIAPARACTVRAPANSGAWVVLARALGSTGHDAEALAAATTGLALVPRDPDLLRSQATALAALHRGEADAALAAYDRFRSPDSSAELRIQCAADSPRCAREREQGHTHLLHPVVAPVR
ncbi:MAG TPA: multiheme c-type cytochrome [Kofleriaceae bacterium]|nr:multiheme c-type cytochrome [Kofleriaceae bacterium]